MIMTTTTTTTTIPSDENVMIVELCQRGVDLYHRRDYCAAKAAFSQALSLFHNQNHNALATSTTPAHFPPSVTNTHNSNNSTTMTTSVTLVADPAVEEESQLGQSSNVVVTPQPSLWLENNNDGMMEYVGQQQVETLSLCSLHHKSSSTIISALLSFNMAQSKRMLQLHDEARHYYQQTLEMIDLNHHKNHHHNMDQDTTTTTTTETQTTQRIIIACYSNMALLAYRNSHWQVAIFYYQHALSYAMMVSSVPALSSSNTHNNHTIVIGILLHGLGMVHYRQSRSKSVPPHQPLYSYYYTTSLQSSSNASKQALEYLQRALSVMLQSQQRNHHPTLSSCLGLTSSSRSVVSTNDDESKQQQQQQQSDHNVAVTIATIYHTMGHVQMQLGDYASAHASYKHCFTLRQQRLGPTHYDTATTLYHIGNALQHQTGHYHDAFCYYHSYISHPTIRSRYHHRDVQDAFTAMVNTCRQIIESDLLEYLEEAHDSPDGAEICALTTDVVGLLSAVGDYYLEQRDHDRALQSYQQCILLERALHDHNNHTSSPSSQSRYNSFIAKLYICAEIYRQRGEMRRALGALVEVVNIHKASQNNNNSADTANALYVMSRIYSQMGATQMAITKLYEVVRIRRHVLGAQHVDVATTLVDLAALLVRADRIQEAQRNYESALAIRFHGGARYHTAISSITCNIGVCHTLQGNYLHAINWFHETLSIDTVIAKSQANDGSSLLSRTLMKLGEVYTMSNNYDMAHDTYQRALTIERRLLSTTNSHRPCRLIHLLREIGNLYLLQWNIPAMMAVFVETARWMQRHIPNNNINNAMDTMAKPHILAFYSLTLAPAAPMA